MIFRSDNTAGASPAVIDALLGVNPGYQGSYGADDATLGTQARLSEIFECSVDLLMCTTGTAANAIGLGAVTPSFGHCYCHELAHIRVDECNAIPMVTGGANLWPVAGAAAKISPKALDRAIDSVDGSVHMGKPSSLGITQATERGTLYTLDELEELCAIAHARDLKIHLDGARFANALVALDCTPAEMSWKRGVDLLTFGSTKNGTFSAEALIIFDPSIMQTAGYLHKRMAQLSSKMRFQSAQLLAYLEDDLWLDNARHANNMAQYLVQTIEQSGIGRLAFTVEANMVFWQVPKSFAHRLEQAGHHLIYDDSDDDGDHDGAGSCTLRLVCAFDVTTEAIDGFMRQAVGDLQHQDRQAK